MTSKNKQIINRMREEKKDESITNFFNTIHPLNRQALNFITSMSYSLNIKKGDLIIQPGEKNNHVYLINRGVVRGYIIDNDREITTWINEEKEVVSSIRNLGLNIPSEEYLQALEDCALTGISYSAIEYLYENFPASNIIGRIILEDSYRAAEERAFLCRINSAGRRYDRFLQTQGQLINRIPLRYIASYLNMTLETLSRLRKNYIHG